MSKLRVVFSTGSPLTDEDFRYVYAKVKAGCDVGLHLWRHGHLFVFCIREPDLPVRSGNCRLLDWAWTAGAFDRDSEQFVVGEKAELVCATPMVPAPVCFYGADSVSWKNLIGDTS